MLKAVREEQNIVTAAREDIEMHEKRLAELDTEIAQLEAAAEIVAAEVEVEGIRNKYLKVDGVHCTAWLLNHPTAVDTATKAELVATLVQFVVWMTKQSPHMQQVALGDTLIFSALFEAIAVKPASFWGTGNELVFLLEDMSRSEVPTMHELLMKSGMLIGLQGVLDDPTLTELSVDLMAVIICTLF